MGFPSGTTLKNLPTNAEDARDMGSISGSGRSPGEGNDNPLQYSCLDNSMDRGDSQVVSMGLERVRHESVTEHIGKGENAETKEEYSRNNRAMMSWGPGFSSRDIHNNIFEFFGRN